jgi:hypothetical protein
MTISFIHATRRDLIGMRLSIRSEMRFVLIECHTELRYCAAHVICLSGFYFVV